jgi:beta-lactam-binding protein with PASTA domain
MTLAAARSALYAADFATYSWLYGCYGSSNINEVTSQSPGGGAKVPRTTHVKIYLQANNC